MIAVFTTINANSAIPTLSQRKIKNDAMKELLQRFDDETDDGSSAYDLLEMVEVE